MGGHEAFWRGQILIDAPDTNSVETLHRDVVRELSARADVLVVVAHRQSIAELASATFVDLFAERRGMVFVLGRTDELDPSAEGELLEQLRGLARDRWRAPDAPVLSVSARRGKADPEAGGLPGLRRALADLIAEERLGVGDVAYGWLRAAPGIGSAVMGILLAMRPIERRVGSMLLLVIGVFGAGHVVLGLTTNYAVAFCAILVAAGADMVSMTIRSTLVPVATPDDQLGRVTAVESVFIGASNELGAFESGGAARWRGVPWAVAGGGVATIAIVGLFAVFAPALRRVDTYADVDARRHTAAPSPTA